MQQKNYNTQHSTKQQQSASTGNVLYLLSLFSPKKKEKEMWWLVLVYFASVSAPEEKRPGFLVKGQSGLFLLPVGPPSPLGIKKTTNTLAIG